MAHIDALPPGPLAIIGDVHGELGALDALLSWLDTRHPDHHIVFLGDLADRGPDSPGVIRRVRERMKTGAQCVLGNHELSVICSKDKGYNRWFFSDAGPWCPAINDQGERATIAMEPLAPERRNEIAAFFATLPLALERADLRVVHACWDNGVIERIRESSASARELFEAGPRNDIPEPEANTRREGSGPAYRDPAWEAAEMAQQNANDIAVLTSGKERRAGQHDTILWSGGKWRPLVRERWWDTYSDDIPVVIGHYAHQWRPETHDKKTHMMFPESSAPGAPVGLKRNVYCVDYGVGGRFHERHHGVSSDFKGRLAALLWRAPEAPRLLFDDGSYGSTSSAST